MHPILFTLGDLTLTSYTAARCLSAVIVTVFCLRRGPRRGVSRNTVLDLVCVSLIGGVIGSRGWNLLLHGSSPLRLDFFRSGGGASVGGLTLALLLIGAYIVAQRLNFLTIADALAPGWLLALALAKIGCFGAGCCYGTATDSVFGVAFPAMTRGPFPPGTPLWPTQLFMMDASILGFVLVLWLERYVTFRGATFAMVFAYYALAVFAVDQFRYYPPAQILGRLGPVSFNWNHLFLAGLLAVSGIAWRRGRRRRF